MISFESIPRSLPVIALLNSFPGNHPVYRKGTENKNQDNMSFNGRMSRKNLEKEPAAGEHAGNNDTDAHQREEVDKGEEECCRHTLLIGIDYPPT